jgi:cell division protein FtsB
MKFLHYLIVIPLLAVAVLAIYTADPEGDGIPCMWYSKPFDTKLVLLIFLVYGYIIGRIGAWFGYSPLRRDLRRQKKANKVLNKEQAKLNETVSGLKQDIAGLQEKAQKEAQHIAEEEKKDIKAWWNGFKQKITAKKGN